MSMFSARRYLSVWLRRLSTDRIERRLAAPDEAARVLAAPIKSARRITALNDAAARLGLRAGMAVADARAVHPRIAVEEADPEADRHLLEAVADWCDRYTPLVALDPPDGLVLDITGCAHLFGGEAALARDLVARLSRQGLRARVAVADTPGCAWGVGRYGAPGAFSSEVGTGSHEENATNRRAGIVPPGETQAALLPLPAAALRIEPETAGDLKTMGLVLIGDIAARPRAPLAARFGADLIRRLDRALGRAEEPIEPRLPVPDAVAERRFAEPIAREDDVLAAIAQLAGRLAGMLERRGEGARLIQLALFRADGAVHRLTLGTSAPLRDPARVRRLFQERLAVLGDACDPGFGFDLVRLAVLAGERIDPMQTGLAAPDHSGELAHLIDRLGARFGPQRVRRLMPQDTHIPELAVAAVPAHRAQPAMGVTACEQDTLAAARPIRLFARPEPIEAVAEVPDGPPARFRWRRAWHEVIAAEGPERIAPEWWRGDGADGLTRDYYRVESRSGARLWLYRDGFYRQDAPAPRWYLHGLFA